MSVFPVIFYGRGLAYPCVDQIPEWTRYISFLCSGLLPCSPPHNICSAPAAHLRSELALAVICISAMSGQPPTPLIEARSCLHRIVRRIGASRPRTNISPLASPSRMAERVPSGYPGRRPASGSCVLPRTPGMVALAQQFDDHALMATVLGTRPAVSPTNLL